MKRRGFLYLLGGLAGLAARAGISDAPLDEGQGQGTSSGIIGMYVHQHWPYNHPYAARTWTAEDYRGYADGLTKLGLQHNYDLARPRNDALAADAK